MNAQVVILVKESKILTSKVKFIEDDKLQSKTKLKDMERRLDEAEVRQDALELYTRKFDLVIHRIFEREDANNADNVIESGKPLNV